MRRSKVWTVAVALGLAVQLVVVSGACANGPEPTVRVAASVTGVLATVIALPVKLVTCVTTVAMGGTGYGLTAGHSEFVEDELLAGLPDACGTQLHTTPQAVEPFTREP